MKRNKYIYGVMAVAALTATLSCTDFDDYNSAFDGSSDNLGTKATQTLWANISSQQNLSQFSEVLKKTGFDKQLDGTRFYTVWAPENGTFNYDSLMAVDSTAMMDRFVQNHVANFNFPVTESTFNERVHMLNNKSYTFEGTANGTTFDGIKVDQANIPGINGTMHSLSNGAVAFLPSLYEYVLDTVEAKTASFDSISAYLFAKEERKPDYTKSIEGPIDENGNQTYSYIVYNVVNPLVGATEGRSVNSVNARWDIEDSTFTVVVPTNKAYIDAYERIAKCYNYVSSVNYWKFPEKTDVAATSEKVNVKVAQMDTTTTRTYLFNQSTFNNNNWRNRWLVNPDDPNKDKTNDTICSTRYYYFSNATELLNDHLVKRVRMSNGWAHIVDSLAYHPWEFWNPMIQVNIFSKDYRARVLAATPYTRSVAYDELDTEKGTDLYRYLELQSADGAQSDSYFYINGVRSTTYQVYVVTVPANIKIGSTEPSRSYKFKVTMNYADANGAVKAVGTPSVDLGTFTSDSTKIDTINVGKVTFPVAYYNTNAYPFIQIKSMRSTWNKKEWDTLDNDLRIAAIYLVPEDYDAYLKEQNEANNPEQTEE